MEKVDWASSVLKGLTPAFKSRGVGNTGFCSRMGLGFVPVHARNAPHKGLQSSLLPRK